MLRTRSSDLKHEAEGHAVLTVFRVWNLEQD